MKTKILIIGFLLLLCESLSAVGSQEYTYISNPDVVNQEKERFKKILERFCTLYYDSYYLNYSYIAGTLEVKSLELDDELKVYTVRGTHSYKGGAYYADSLHCNVKYIANIEFVNANEVTVRFYKGIDWSIKDVDVLIPSLKDRYDDEPCVRTFKLTATTAGTDCNVKLSTLYKGKKDVVYYGVQIKTKSKLDGCEFAEIAKPKGLYNLYYEDRGSNISMRYRYILGVWSDEESAKKCRNKIKDKYADAYIVRCKNGKTIQK